MDLSIGQDMQENFHNQPLLVNLMQSIFSHQKTYTELTKFKIPFTLSIKELTVFEQEDARTSVFGVLFSGAVVLCFMKVLFLLMSWKFDVSKNSNT